jgi:uncharacterized membrane protein
MQTEAMDHDAYERAAWMEDGTQMLTHGHGTGLAGRENYALQTARRLAWFSVALGTAELFLPRLLASLAGARVGRRTSMTGVRLLGLREIASGLGILSQKNPAPWLWARVAGDVMDLAVLGRTLVEPRTERARTMTAIASVVGVTAMDLKSALELTRNGTDASPVGVHVLSAITVNRPREEVYLFWRDFEHLPLFMSHLESVEVHGSRSTWRAKGIAGITFEWDAELVADQPNENIAWRSCEGSQVPNQGSVRFLDAPGGRGTEVRVELRYDPPAGKLGASFAKLFGKEPGQEIAGDLRRFKQVIETGEVLHSDASIHRRMHPARPSSSPSQDGRATGGRAAKTTRSKSQGRGREVAQ